MCLSLLRHPEHRLGLLQQYQAMFRTLGPVGLLDELLRLFAIVRRSCIGPSFEPCMRLLLYDAR